MLNITDTDRATARRVIRRALDVRRTNMPVDVIPGNDAPEITGRGFHHVNKSGDLIRFPNAYARKFGKPIYVPSTLSIEVGEGYLAAIELAAAQGRAYAAALRGAK